jgi:hypothetical protein
VTTPAIVVDDPYRTGLRFAAIVAALVPPVGGAFAIAAPTLTTSAVTAIAAVNRPKRLFLMKLLPRSL